MFEQIFEILDIPLVCVFLILTVFGMLIIKNIYSIFLSLFISILMLVFLSSTILTQQIYLGEFLVISSFFMLIIVFFIFNLNNNIEILEYQDDEKINTKKIVVIVSCVLIFGLLSLQFNKILRTDTKFITQNVEQQVVESKKMNKQEQIEYNDYLEKISLLNQNKVFQKLTHVVMFYTCALIMLYFFNKKGENNER